MHDQDVNTEKSKKQTGATKSLFDFASDLEPVTGNLDGILKSARKELCGDADHSILFAMVESAQRIAGDVRQLMLDMYQQGFEAKQPAAAPAMNEKADPPVNLSLAHHATAAKDAAGLGMCCVNELTTYLEGIQALADPDGLTDSELRRRLETVCSMTKLAIRFADDLHHMFDCERETKEEAVKALMEAGHV